MRIAAIVVALALGCACRGESELPVERLIADAQAALRSGRLSAAAELVGKGKLATAGAPDTIEAWQVRLAEAELLLAQLQVPDALTILESPVPAGDGFDLVRDRQTLLHARADISQRKLNEAAARLAGLMESATDPDLRMDAEHLAGQIALRKGQWAAGESALMAVAAEAAGQGDPYRQARALNDIGMGYVVRSRYDEALSWFEKVIALRGIETENIYGSSLHNAGLSLARLGQFDRAEDLQARAIEILEGGGRQDYLQALGEMGNTFLLQNDEDRALPFLERAFEIALEGAVPSVAALQARNLAVAYARKGDWDRAARFIAEARRLEPEARLASELIAAVTEAQVAAGRGEREEAMRGFAAVLDRAGDEPAAEFLAYDGLSRLAISGGDPRGAERYLDAALAAIDRTRGELVRADFKLSYLVRRINFYYAYVDILIDQGRIDRALEIADSSRGRVLAEGHGVEAPARATAASFRRLARDTGRVLLFYWLAPRASRVWVVTADAVRVATLPPVADIEQLVAAHQSTLQNAFADPLAAGTTPGDRLYQALVAPVEAEIPAGASVVIVPDGALGRINFETLTTGEGTERGKHYWIEDVTIQVAPALALLEREAARPAPGSLLLVGDPAPRLPEFAALSYASAEMSGIASHFAAADVTTLSGQQATPDAFRSAGPERFSAIHFTSHAVASLDSPLDSAVILSGPDQAYKLYAREVAAMPLAADLVTVSACRSAGERAYAGEGLVGFAWAFLRAGSHRVVAGLWDVDDRSTAMLMEDVYARIAKGVPPPAALREAKLSLIEQGFPKPYYWAPFQMFTVVL